MPGHFAFNYVFDELTGGGGTGDGINFSSLPEWPFEGDLLIYYDTLVSGSFIACRCSRWDSDDYSITLETWLKEDDMKTIIDHLRPGAAGEFYKILGRPTYYDKTWTNDNTLRLRPTNYSNYREGEDVLFDPSFAYSTLPDMRSEKYIFVKNIVTHPLNDENNWIEVKIEGYVSGAVL